ncbi:MAG: hypothetical protein HQK89_02470 [Nitrospirae bacterium]|nr:hypothetical protein [Nitrospirota bacterium]
MINMIWSIYAYVVFVIVLSIMFFGIFVYYFSKDMQDRGEYPKFTVPGGNGLMAGKTNRIH